MLSNTFIMYHMIDHLMNLLIFLFLLRSVDTFCIYYYLKWANTLSPESWSQVIIYYIVPNRPRSFPGSRCGRSKGNQTNGVERRRIPGTRSFGRQRRVCDWCRNRLRCRRQTARRRLPRSDDETCPPIFCGRPCENGSIQPGCP